MANKTYRNSNSRRRSQDRRADYERVYVYGNTVRRLEQAEEVEVQAPKRPRHTTSKNRSRALNTDLHTNLGYLTFLVAALASAAYVLIGYLKLQSELTLTIQNISSLESELNNLRLANEEEYNRAVSSVDLETIRQVAIGELGMRYAKEGQIINVSGEGSDYVRQLTRIE